MTEFCACGNQAHKKGLCVACLNEETGHLTITYTGRRIKRNQLCPCGSGKKFKSCHKRDAFLTLQVEQRDNAVDSVRTRKGRGEGHSSVVRDDASTIKLPLPQSAEEGIRRQTEGSVFPTVQLGGLDAGAVVRGVFGKTKTEGSDTSADREIASPDLDQLRQ